MNIVVLAKQVPDTHNVTGQAMKDDGTVNRAALPRLFNPEDLNALEMALALQDAEGGSVRVITMGPPEASEILKESLTMGADKGILVCDRRFAGADTLATSYVLAKAIEATGDVDVVVCGRQAIDGDTAQIGPQVAQKLNIQQVTYAEEILAVQDGKMELTRQMGRHRETIRTDLPVLLTVTSSANIPRPARAKRIMQYKRAVTALEQDDAANAAELEAQGLFIPVLSADDIDVDPDAIGLKGSPTKVKNIESVVLVSQDMKTIEPNDAGVKALIDELVSDHILG